MTNNKAANVADKYFYLENLPLDTCTSDLATLFPSIAVLRSKLVLFVATHVISFIVSPRVFCSNRHNQLLAAVLGEPRAEVVVVLYHGFSTGNDDDDVNVLKLARRRI